MKRLIIFLALFLFLASSVYAETSSADIDSSSSASTKPAVTKDHNSLKQASQSSAERLSKGIDRGVKEIDRRVDSLSKLIDKINAMKKLSATSKSAFSSQLQTEIDSLNSLKTKIQADTDIDTLKTDLQSVVKDYRVYALYLPKMRIFIAADRLGVAADNLSGYSQTLSSKINEKETAGEDMSEEKQTLAEINSLVTSAKDKYSQAIALATPLLPENYPDNKDTIKQAQDLIKQGAKDLKSAFEKSVELRKILGEKPKGSLSPSNL